MPDLGTEYLFSFTLDLGETIDVGTTPIGHRLIGPITGGTVEGPALQGAVVADGGDWLFQRGDGALELDVRATLRARDGALIYMPYTGLAVIPEGKLPQALAGELAADAYYLRVALRFETASEEYDWLNRVVAVGSGRLGAGTVTYDVFAVR